MALASAMPNEHHAERDPARVAVVVQDGRVGDILQVVKWADRKVKQAIATPMAEMTAEMKKPRLIEVIPLRSCPARK